MRALAPSHVYPELKMETILFEFKGSRREIELNRNTVCRDVERELLNSGVKDVFVSLCEGFGGRK